MERWRLDDARLCKRQRAAPAVQLGVRRARSKCLEMRLNRIYRSSAVTGARCCQVSMPQTPPNYLTRGPVLRIRAAKPVVTPVQGAKADQRLLVYFYNRY
jgi:hypothetical protein